jgi:hypothetical protein
MNEQELLADCLRRLNRCGVTDYLTGSMASNYWGIPCTTHDLDFVVQLPTSAIPAINARTGRKASKPSRKIKPPRSFPRGGSLIR